MIQVSLRDLRSVRVQLAGASVGQADRRLVFETVRTAIREGVAVLIFDFSGIEVVTASYFKSFLFWFLDAGRLHADGAVSGGAFSSDDPMPLDVFPTVSGVNAEVGEELEMVLARHGRVVLEALDTDAGVLRRARVWGALDRSLLWTLQLLTKLSEATAPELHEQHGAEEGKLPGTISVNAWNNRLVELHRLRFASRTKVGRFWVYRPIMKEIAHG